ncbi:MAG: YdcF family protein [Verrucomicrobia bacterium]|nr:YdcF family protein [Verrucomicrobiota bacterium]
MLPVIWWWFCGESFLSANVRLPAEVLVVEGWIGREGVRAAASEFERGGYRYVVTSGGSATGWEDERESYAVMAEQELLQAGIPEKEIIVATPSQTETERTFTSAVAVWRALQSKGIYPKKINVFTLGAHARRSRVVFTKLNLPETQVGVISWSPPKERAGPWWRSSQRAKEMIAESAGYLFEVLCNSGRSSNSPKGDGLLNFAENQKGPPPGVASP